MKSVKQYLDSTSVRSVAYMMTRIKDNFTVMDVVSAGI